MEAEEKEPAPTVLDRAARLYGGTDSLDGLSDAEIRRRVVEDVLAERGQSDAWISGAFKALTEGDARISLLRRDLARAAHRHPAHGTRQ